jgi:DnaJ-class molecular chaperone
MCKSWRVVLCEACGSEGRIYIDTYQRDEYGNMMEAAEECPYCEGTGGELIETQPIELADLDQMGVA